MSKLDKSRKTMKAVYFASKVSGVASKYLGHYGLARLSYMSMANSSIFSECVNTPWEVFNSEKPVIDKRRAKRYHRKHIRSLEANGSYLTVEMLADDSKFQEGMESVKVKLDSIAPVGIDNALPNGSGHYKQLAGQLELRGKLESAILSKDGEL